MASEDYEQDESRNVLGQPLQTCGTDPVTGFYRDGCCNTGPDDRGVHTVCAVVTDEFLEASRRLGNDLITPAPHFGFPGLHAGDRWCVCAARWLQAYEAGSPCPIVLEATHENTLRIIPFEILLQYAVIPDKLV
ncbi:DUF2237 family protein [Terriglobus aquaticus]|uniref:DUF2237 family protein n=1 Tax=Terriglobus aquaticus TaxID=940139 RepID=A0ABW9KJD9_9BACT|nr:DUF2237 domain-containing protein [Terriglobus aquaticus]